MKKIILLLVLIATQVSTFASTSIVLTTNDDNNLVVAQGKDGKYGYKVSGEEKFVIKPKFLSAKPFVNGMAIVSVSSKNCPLYGTIDTKGKFIIKPIYKALGDFKNGLAKIMTDNGWGLVNEAGLEVLRPEYKTVEDFEDDGLAKVISENGSGLVNSLGTIVLPLKYHSLKYYKNKGIWESFDENNFLSIYEAKYGKLLDETEQYFLLGKVTNYIYKVQRGEYIYLLRYEPEDKINGAIAQVYNFGCFSDIRLYEYDFVSAVLAKNKDGKWEVYNDYGYPAVRGSYDSVETSFCPSHIILIKNGKRHLYSVNKKKLLGDSLEGYNDIWKGYSHDWVMIGDSYYCIDNETKKIYGNNVVGVSIEMLGSSIDKLGWYIVNRRPSKKDILIYSDDTILKDNAMMKDSYVKSVWDRLPNDIKQTYIDAGVMSPIIKPIMVIDESSEVEIARDGNIYTCLSPFHFILPSGSIYFYISDSNYPREYLGEYALGDYYIPRSNGDINGIFNSSNNKAVRLETCFHNVNFNRVGFLQPHCLLDIDNNHALIAYYGYYQGKPFFQYAPYQYVVFAGQLMQVNGPGYEVNYHRQGFLSILDKNNMVSTKTVVLEGIEIPYMELYYDELLCWNYRKWGVSSPTYLLDKELNIKSKFVFEEGVSINGYALSNDFIVFCGSDKNHGYVGFNNPICIIIDKKSYKIINTIRKQEKGRFFSKARIKNRTIILEYGEGTTVTYDIDNETWR